MNQQLCKYTAFIREYLATASDNSWSSFLAHVAGLKAVLPLASERNAEDSRTADLYTKVERALQQAVLSEKTPPAQGSSDVKPRKRRVPADGQPGNMPGRVLSEAERDAVIDVAQDQPEQTHLEASLSPCAKYLQQNLAAISYAEWTAQVVDADFDEETNEAEVDVETMTISDSVPGWKSTADAVVAAAPTQANRFLWRGIFGLNDEADEFAGLLKDSRSAANSALKSYQNIAWHQLLEKNEFSGQ
ncbi:hypothetical protein HDU88_000456 [Geranomyces variabilis]|nr:hypothetical protein HDU88_000456 [Geranomyces variabilis]